MPIPTPLECDKENEWFTEELPSRKYGGYRSRIRSGEFDHPCGDLARRGSDLGGGGGGEELLVDFCRPDARVMGH